MKGNSMLMKNRFVVKAQFRIMELQVSFHL
jgi:hypothetical protein